MDQDHLYRSACVDPCVTPHNPLPDCTMPSTRGTLTPAMVALAPLDGSTVYSRPLVEWATIRVLPSGVAWYLVGTEDRAIPPAGQRFMAERGNAQIDEVAASHASMVSQPEAVTRLILSAVEATAAARP